MTNEELMWFKNNENPPFDPTAHSTTSPHRLVPQVSRHPMQSPLNNFEFNSTAHARACGIATGAFIKAGIPIRPIYDDSGNYVPAFIVEIENKTYCLTLTPLK